MLELVVEHGDSAVRHNPLVLPRRATPANPLGRAIVPTEQLAALTSSIFAVIISLGSLIVSYLSFKRSGPQLSVEVEGVIERANKNVASISHVGLTVTNSGQAAIQIKVVGFEVSYKRGWFRWRLGTRCETRVKSGTTRLEGYHSKSCYFHAPLFVLSLFHNKGRDAWLRGVAYTGSGKRIVSRPVKVSRYALSDGFSTSWGSIRKRHVLPSMLTLRIWASVHLPERISSKVGLPPRYKNRQKWREWRLDRIEFLEKGEAPPKEVELIDG
ncbi:hypothetical protein [Micromonospora inositola]|uniref:hypothetical protein n=1 Tax=Micromonospora inositola TaxID=47865 RepID=UPI0012FE3313|nr:hypothetical protein [Micromonospora inositola]